MRPRSLFDKPWNPPGNGRGRRSTASEATNAAAFYYVKQIEMKTPLLFRMRDGEELKGLLEWYDRGAYRLNLDTGGHVVVMKSAVSSIRKA